MKNIQTVILFFSLLVLFPQAQRAEDVIVMKSGNQKKGNVENFGNGTLVFDGREMPFAEIASVTLDEFEVPAKPRGLVLRDGSRLNGDFKRTKETTVLRSPSLGTVEIGNSDIAVIYFSPNFENSAIPDSVHFPALIKTDMKTVVSGKILWSDSKSAGILGKDGLVKIKADEIYCVCYSRPKDNERIVLRNGDVINAPGSFKENIYTFELSEKKYRIPTKAFKIFKEPVSRLRVNRVNRVGSAGAAGGPESFEIGSITCFVAFLCLMPRIHVLNETCLNLENRVLKFL